MTTSTSPENFRPAGTMAVQGAISLVGADDLQVVLFQLGVGGEDRQTFNLCLGDNEPIIRSGYDRMRLNGIEEPPMIMTASRVHEPPVPRNISTARERSMGSPFHKGVAVQGSGTTPASAFRSTISRTGSRWMGGASGTDGITYPVGETNWRWSPPGTRRT